MTEYVWKHLPYAIYFDTNAIRSASPSLNQPWISELLSIANKYGINLYISELVLREWCKHIIETLQTNKSKLFSSLSLLGEYGIKVPNIDVEQVSLPDQKVLIETVRTKMSDMGFEFIQNWDAPLSHLLDEAVDKIPPFEHGGKGLCDAVILESYANHAKGTFDNPRVLLVSRDEAVRNSKGRFTKYGIAVEFLKENEVVNKLKSLLTDEVAAYTEEQATKLTNYVCQYENQVLDHARETPIHLSDWFLNPPGLDEQNKIRGSINKVLSVKPTRILQVVGGSPAYGIKVPDDRYPLQIYVEFEIDIMVSDYTTGAFQQMMQTRAIVQPNMLEDASPIELNSTFNLTQQERAQSIKRTVTFYATIDAKKEKEGIYDDFKIEKIS